MNSILITSLLLGLINYTLLQAFRKWWLQKRYEESYYYARYSWLPKYCELCLGFWLAVTEVTAIGLIGQVSVSMYVLAPFAAAAITHKLLK